MKPTSKRVGEIELFRAIFCLIIMIRHGGEMFGTLQIPFGGGAFGVEFFFLVSGYLMMATIAKRLGQSTDRLGTETLTFVGRKMGAFYPEMVVAYIVGFVIESVAMKLNGQQVYELFMNDPFEVLLLRMTGLGRNTINGAVWYLQSMILCMLILYPLIRKFPDMMQKVVMPLVAVLLLGWLCRNYTDLRNPNLWIDFTFKGNVRGLAELSLGAVAYPIVQWLKGFRLTLPYRIGLTVLKWGCWLSLLAYMYKNNTKYDAFFCLVFFLAIVLAFSQQGVDAGLYQNRFVYWLGKMSLPYFLSHIFFAQDLPLLLPKDASKGTMWAAYFGCTIVTTAIVYWCGKGIRLLGAAIKNRFEQMRAQA